MRTKKKKLPAPKFDDFHYFEVMDRISVIRYNWDRFIMEHPVTVSNFDLHKACCRVERALSGAVGEAAKLNFKPDQFDPDNLVQSVLAKATGLQAKAKSTHDHQRKV